MDNPYRVEISSLSILRLQTIEELGSLEWSRGMVLEYTRSPDLEQILLQRSHLHLLAALRTTIIKQKKNNSKEFGHFVPIKHNFFRKGGGVAY